VPHDSPIHSPEELAGVPISVGYQSGSHYSSIQALEQYLPADKISLSFTEGMLFKRLDNLLEGKSKASTLFSGPYYLAEQLGYRKIIDTTFMIASMITGTPDDEDLKRFLRALKRAQRDIDLRPELYTHYYKNEFPVRYHGIMGSPLGTRRAHRVRALYGGSFRAVARLDRGAGNLRGRQVTRERRAWIACRDCLPGSSARRCGAAAVAGRRLSVGLDPVIGQVDQGRPRGHGKRSTQVRT